jgi:hypothetical protein
MRPELPYLAAGGVTIMGGAIAEKQWPSNTTKVLIGTTVLVVVASATADSKLAPLVHAFGLLVLLSATLAATSQNLKTKKKVK